MDAARGGTLLAITGGHRFDEAAFAAMLGAVSSELGWSWEHARHPAAQRWLAPEHAGRFDAIVLHDLPGLTLERGTEPIAEHPPAEVRDAMLALLAAGQGIVATHHALAAWPTWDAWAEVLGGRFCYAPGVLQGEAVPPSGYRMDTYPVEVTAPGHPVCAGIEPFELTDELYLCPIFEHANETLLSTAAEISPASTFDTFREVRDGMRVSPERQPGSSALAWAKQSGAGRLVYVLPGHNASTMANPMYRRLLANACRWVAE